MAADAVVNTQPNQQQSKVAAPPAKSSRVVELDMLRGFLLVWMCFTHLPTRISNYSNQAIGFVSAAEGFIFLAALLIGHIQIRAQEKHGPREAFVSLLRRTLRIYRYHLGLLLFMLVFVFALANQWRLDAWQDQFDFFLAHPREALAGAILLLYNPPLFDILPMYVAFMLFTPLILWAAAKRGWFLVLSISATVWLLAQFGLREWIYNAFAHLAFPIPLQEMGAFNLFGWQVLWVASLALAAQNPLKKLSGEKIPAWIVGLAAVVAVTLLICRHTAFDRVVGPEVYGVLVDKWRLGPLRLVDFAAIGIILVRFGHWLGSLPFVYKFGTLGRSSLEVFCTHIFICIVALGFSQRVAPPAEGYQLKPYQEAIAVMATLAGLPAVAMAAERWRKNNAD